MGHRLKNQIGWVVNADIQKCMTMVENIGFVLDATQELTAQEGRNLVLNVRLIPTVFMLGALV